eukprot:scaffold30138_cov131-Skeletonema_marinoi.AAC.2
MRREDCLRQGGRLLLHRYEIRFKMSLMKRMWNNYGVCCQGVQSYWGHEDLHCFVRHHSHGHRQIQQRFLGVAPVPDWAWSDTATLDLLKSIVLDGEIPSLLIVGAYREDEVPE